ncbi:hypothetical protein [uncultured Flavobacterium sp.]|uniref:hypothetical protein n=1 Tax=uncultured Flavobacterium sp. TaxID=165435 RepID=UPI0025F1EE89|nr:hypothetical protein [uncultured Flavobacterium sp.]
MKKLIIAAVLMIGMTSFAQEKPAGEKGYKMERLTPAQRNEKHLQKLTSELSLNEKQQKEVGTILAEQSAKREAKQEERKKLTDAQRNERKAEMEANDAKIKAILTPEQTKKWEELKAKKKEEFKDKREERKEKRAKK